MKMELRSRALDKLYKRRDRIDMPDFQREEVWADHQKRQLIDTILRGWHLPKFYFRKVEEATYECVDGQQRLAAIFEFYDGHLRLDPKAARAYGGRTYKDLRPTCSDAFDDFEIDIEEIEDATDRDLEDLFVRLQLGTPLTTAEKLNALGGDPRDFAKWASDQDFFERGIAVRDTRYAHFDIAVKWLFLETQGIQPQMRFAQLEPFLKNQNGFDATGPVARRIRAALAFLKRAFPERSAVLRNRASVLSVCMLAGRVVEAHVAKGSARTFGRFVAHFFMALSEEVEKGAKSRDVDLRRYQEAISYGSTGGESIRARLGILSRRLAAFDPVFAPLLRKASGTDAAESLGEEIATLVYAANERAAAESGVDIFKMTNKSARALKRLGKSCNDQERLGELLDDLYFLVYEGTGDCNRLPSPPPQYAMDVKFLRTQFRHDLDHGAGRDAAKKRCRGGDVVRRYLGVAAVEDAASEQCAAGQLRLLEGFRQMLRLLANGSSAA
jgi:hypothetical protein